jgi:hypothetical protein
MNPNKQQCSHSPAEISRRALVRKRTQALGPSMTALPAERRAPATGGPSTSRRHPPAAEEEDSPISALQLDLRARRREGQAQARGDPST